MPEARDFLVPDLGEGLEEATVVAWLVAVGDVVELNQTLCTVETAKAEVDIPSPYAGLVARLGGADGETLAVGSLLVQITTGVDAAPVGAPPGDVTAAEGRQPTLVGYGPDASNDRSRRGRSAAPVPVADPPAIGAGVAVLAKPPVRKLARDLGLDLRSLAPGSGPGGIVTRSDVLAASAPSPVAPAAAPVRTAGPEDLVIPVRGVRSRIAERMSTSRREIPDATATVVADCERLLQVRADLRDALERRGTPAPITPFSLICELLVRALRAHPILNATFDAGAGEIRQHGAVHLGVGTATDRGLLVTVVRDAHALGVAALSTEMRRLSEAARSGAATPAELVGSTFTVSNFGALGLDEGVPVINHPEAAILGIGAVRQRPHVVDGELAVRHTASLTLAFDHRVADGAEAARLLTTLRDLIEAPELAMVTP